MELIDAASSFDDESFADAYAVTYELFSGQLDLYDGSKRDGSTVVRRVLSVVPGTEMPARGAIISGSSGLNYILGLKTEDSFGGSSLREKYIIQRSDALATIETTLQALAGSGGIDARAGMIWLKNVKDERESSESSPVYNIYFNDTETVTKGLLVSIASILYRVKVIIKSTAGFKLVEAYEIEAVTEAMTHNPDTGVKDVANDTYIAGTPAAFTGLRERFLSFYENEDAAMVKFEPGDMVISATQAEVISPETGETITAGGETWNIIDIRDPGDATWAMHVRQA